MSRCLPFYRDALLARGEANEPRSTLEFSSGEIIPIDPRQMEIRWRWFAGRNIGNGANGLTTEFGESGPGYAVLPGRSLNLDIGKLS